jgi:hypothetical protein
MELINGITLEEWVFEDKEWKTAPGSNVLEFFKIF